MRVITADDLPEDHDAYIAALVESAPPLDSETAARIRALIPPLSRSAAA